MSNHIDNGIKVVNKDKNVLQVLWEKPRGMRMRELMLFNLRCAVRVLPFISRKTIFEIWGEDAQDILIAIFRILDLISYTTLAVQDLSGDNIVDSIHSARNKLKLQKKYNDELSGEICKTIEVAGITATLYLIGREPKKFRTNEIHDCPASASSASANIGMNTNEFRQMLMGDITDIERLENTCFTTPFYSNAWSKLESCLDEIGCKYWYTNYANFYESGFIPNREELEVRLSLPESIYSKGATHVAKTLDLGSHNGVMEKISEARLIVLGDKGAGKTCITRRLQDPIAPMTKANESTSGVDTHIWRVEEEGCKVRIWDFAGHTVTHSAHKFFLSERCLYLIVYNGRTDNEERLIYWLDQMKNYGGRSEAVILVNKWDENEADISINSIKERYNIAEFFTFSVQDDSKELLQFTKKIVDLLIRKPSWDIQKIPASDFKVKEKIESYFIEGSEEFIDLERFNEIASIYNVKDTDTLLKNLDALGVSLWYPDLSNLDELVLNPEWITDAVYTIINWANNNAIYKLTIADLERVFESESQRFSKKRYAFIFQLLLHYQLAYQSFDKSFLILPQLLPRDQPEYLPEFRISNSLMLRYRSEHSLPVDSIWRFMCEHNSYFQEVEDVWRFGAILTASNDTIAMVRFSERCIEICTKGSEKKEFLSELRDSMNAIFSQYKNANPEKEYRIWLDQIGLINSENIFDDTIWLSERKIAAHAEKRIPYFEDSTGKSINLINQARNFNINVSAEPGSNVAMGGTIDALTQYNFSAQVYLLQEDIEEMLQSIPQNEFGKQRDLLLEVAHSLKSLDSSADPELLVNPEKFSALKELIEQFTLEDSKFNKAIKGAENIHSIAKKIAQKYNKIAEWTGMPRVPEIFVN